MTNFGTILVLLTILISTLCTNDFQLPLSQSNGLFTTTIDFEDSKKANIQVNIQSSQVTICCKPTNNVFEIIYYFLLNPFSLNYQSKCHDNSKLIQIETIVLPTIGVLDLQFNESRRCDTGVLGLNKKSSFLKTLPIQKKAFTIVIKSNGNDNTLQLYFGKTVNTYSKSSYFILNADSTTDNWFITFLSANYQLINFEKSRVLLSTSQKGLYAPPSQFNNIRNFLMNFRECIQGQGKNIFCPCQSGAPENYPDLNFWFTANYSINIHASQYMEVNSAVCRVLIFESNQSYWAMNLLLLTNYQLEFNYNDSKITISSLTNDDTGTNTIKLPIQLILNCLVILVMCVFVAMIIIQIVKRVSGLADIRDQTFREVMMRRQI